MVSSILGGLYIMHVNDAHVVWLRREVQVLFSACAEMQGREAQEHIAKLLEDRRVREQECRVQAELLQVQCWPILRKLAFKRMFLQQIVQLLSKALESCVSVEGRAGS